VNIPPPADLGPPIPGFNLAGRPDKLLRTSSGIKTQQIKVQGTYHSSNISQDPYIHFVIRANKHEWVRFKPDALSLILYGTYKNPAKSALETATNKQKADVHALRAQQYKPPIYLDPSVMGTSFLQDVSVTINNVPVPTNSCVSPLLLQYTRCCEVFTSKKKIKFINDDQIDVTKAFDEMSPVMKAATAPFDYGPSYSSQKGERIPVYLHGIFPFSLKNATICSMDRVTEPALYFPPDTVIDVKFYTRRTKKEALFLPGMNFKEDYYDRAAAVQEDTSEISLTFQDALLEYESIELTAEQEQSVIQGFRRGGMADYEYDIPRSQNQALPANQSYTENNFQIMPFARLVYIMFLRDWAVLPMDSLRRPNSGFSSFPEDCTNIRRDFAGEKNLITQNFVNFGFTGNNKCQSEISKKIFYQYLFSRKMTSDSFDDFFPKRNKKALNQIFVLDVANQESQKAELLTVSCEFSGTNKSPKDLQVVCISVHQNGKAICHAGDDVTTNWYWEFKQRV
jgi:hypothetical protein